MGTVEDFGEAGGPRAESASTADTAKKLYRNPDDMLIAGVCSGLAAYFGLETLWVRIAFVILTILNGLGIIIYGVLWLLIPLAKTGSQRLEMSGQPVTLGTLTEAVNERLSELKMPERSGLRKVLAVPFVLMGRFISALGHIMGPLARIGVGLFLLVVTLPALVAITIATGFVFSSNIMLVEGLTLQSLMPGALHWLLPLTFLVAALIPVLFILFAAISILRKKAAIPGFAALGLLGVWVIALMGSGFGIAQMATGYQEYVRSSPTYKVATTELPLESSFDALSVSGLHIRIEQATSTRLVAEGRSRDMAMIGAHIADGTLVLERNRVERDDEYCLFCSLSQPDLVLYTDGLGAISAADARITSPDFPMRDTLHLTLDSGASADLALDARALVASLNDHSYLSLNGSLTSLEAMVDRDSRLSADALDTVTADLTLDHGSSAEINASEALTVSARRNSYVHSIGNATTTKEIDQSSSFYAE
jgi:phage shock protein PspC (stress-responsive transcriptional regulator)